MELLQKSIKKKKENLFFSSSKKSNPTVLKLFSVAGVVTFRRSFFLRTNVFVSNDLSVVEGSENIQTKY